MPILVPDTNMLVRSPLLSSPAWESLHRNAAAWDIRISIPEVVFMETVNVVRRDWRAVKTNVAGLKVGVFNLNADQESMVQAIQRQVDDYEQFLQKRIAELGATIFSAPPVDHMDIARRASQGRAPYQGKDKDGYRDTLIWLTLLAVADEHPSEEVWLVSDNTKDFGPAPSSGWTRDDCPLQLHKDLRQELTERALEARVKYVTTLERLEQHLAAQHAPIEEEALNALTSVLNFVELGDYLAVQAAGMTVDPFQSALSVTAAGAVINHLRTDGAEWTFSGAARRGEDSWTAKFDVVLDVDLEVAYPESTRIETKPLRLTGDIEVAEPSLVQSISIADVEALPKDPQRALWEPSPEILESMQRLSAQATLPAETQEKITQLVNNILHRPETEERFARWTKDMALSQERLAHLAKNVMSPAETQERFAEMVKNVTLSAETQERFAHLAKNVMLPAETQEKLARLANEAAMSMETRDKFLKGITVDAEEASAEDDPAGEEGTDDNDESNEGTGDDRK